MAAARAAKPRAARRRWPVSEKRRIVELTLRPGASVGSIAREHDLHPNNLHQWRSLYRAGKLDAQAQPVSRADAPPAGTTFLPVSIVPIARDPQLPPRSNAQGRGRSVVGLVFRSGNTMRIETETLDPALLRALVAELRQ